MCVRTYAQTYTRVQPQIWQILPLGTETKCILSKDSYMC